MDMFIVDGDTCSFVLPIDEPPWRIPVVFELREEADSEDQRIRNRALRSVLGAVTGIAVRKGAA